MAAMTRICFVGAGSVVFTRQLLRDLFRYPDLDELDISLHDVDGDRLDTARGTAEQLARRLGKRATVSTSLDRRTALAGADFVINMIQVGGIEATRIDFAVPAKYGLRQTIADTIGVGGVFRALRTFPVLRDLAVDMARECPEALLLNYTNPMAMNVWWLAEVAPAIAAVGLCHSVYWTVHDLCALVGAGRGGRLPRRRRQPPGLAAAVAPGRAGPVPAAAATDRGRRAAAPAGPGGHVQPVRRLPDRDQ